MVIATLISLDIDQEIAEIHHIYRHEVTFESGVANAVVLCSRLGKINILHIFSLIRTVDVVKELWTEQKDCGMVLKVNF